MKKILYIIMVITTIGFSIACGNAEKKDSNNENTNENTETMELNDEELVEFLWETPQKGWIKEGYTKNDFYYICFGVDYNDHSKTSMMEIYDSNSPAKGTYNWDVKDGKVHAKHQYDESEMDFEIKILSEEKIIINDEVYIPLSNSEATDLQTK